MSFNTFGKIFRFTTWGESHGPAIGCVIDGCPPNIPLSESDIQKDMDRRRQYSSCSSHSRDKDSSRCSCHPRLFRFASIVFGVLLLIDTIRSDIVGNLDHVVEGNQIHPTTTTTTNAAATGTTQKISRTNTN